LGRRLTISVAGTAERRRLGAIARLPRVRHVRRDRDDDRYRGQYRFAHDVSRRDSSAAADGSGHCYARTAGNTQRYVVAFGCCAARHWNPKRDNQLWRRHIAEFRWRDRYDLEHHAYVSGGRSILGLRGRVGHDWTSYNRHHGRDRQLTRRTYI